MGRSSPWATRWLRNGWTPAPGEGSLLTNKKAAWAKDRGYLKWWELLIVGVSQYPSHLTTLEGWKRSPSRPMGERSGGDLWLLGCLPRSMRVIRCNRLDVDGLEYLAERRKGGTLPLLSDIVIEVGHDDAEVSV